MKAPYICLVFLYMIVSPCVGRGETMRTDVMWNGGTDECVCDKLGTDNSYACTPGTAGSGDWANGMQSYEDMQTDPSYVMTQAIVYLYGSFDCVQALDVTVSLNGKHVGTVSVPANNQDPDTCNKCRICWAPFSPVYVASSEYDDGFPDYNEGSENTVELILVSNKTQFCISHLSLMLTYNETTQVSDSSSSSDEIEFIAPAWLWVLIASAGVVVLVLVLTLFILWRRSTNALSSGGSGSGGNDWGAYKTLPSTEYIDPRQLEDISININEFRMDVKIGQGSFGQVHKALWRGTEVAVKRLPRDSVERDELVEFMKEAFIMRQLRHPNVLQVLGVCAVPPCIIMEYMPRGSLFQIIHNANVELDWSIVRKLAVEICRGMAYLHGCNPPLIHRDLKPHNLLVDELWRVKVCDFGLSRFWEAKRDMTACGTPAYAAPEVLRNSAYSVSADVYSFAMVLWELTTRQPLYPGTPPFQIIFTVGTQGMRPIIPPTCNPALAHLIKNCWAENPAARPDFVTLAHLIAQLPAADTPL